jgi:hypothetical protein
MLLWSGGVWMSFWLLAAAAVLLKQKAVIDADATPQREILGEKCIPPIYSSPVMYTPICLIL